MKAVSRCGTLEAAPMFNVKPQTMHKGYCLNGHYLGVVPVKLPNGRLLWPVDAIQAVLNGGAR